MTTKTFIVPDISCGHCVTTIQQEISELDGVQAVVANQATKQVTIEWAEPAQWTQIDATLNEIGYPPQQ